VTLSNEVECDEAYVIAGHKGHPEVLKNKGRKGRRHGLFTRDELDKARRRLSRTHTLRENQMCIVSTEDTT
jgi:4-hydroxy-3-methylbut-2-enyl diphosphate reductase IspH